MQDYHFSGMTPYGYPKNLSVFSGGIVNRIAVEGIRC